ncbi:zinc transporter binding subunit ZevA [Actinobacillus porcinus]|uniref:zinc transporter binding subunit ZevA n=1 Tax=Actinobacillus porcinus TaxID=51048 RepID=UPI00235274A8|nr:zinc transporter binding subunit ZevA [Actinobacillus porcinus]
MKKLLFILLSFCTVQVIAHPHAFIDLKTKLLVENEQLVGFSTQWTLDEASSAELLYELKFSTEENKHKLTEEMFKNIIAEHYFSYLYDKPDNKIKFKNVPVNYGLKASGTHLQYYFDVLLAKPVELKKNELTLATYDKTYFVAMLYPLKDKSAVDFSQLPEHCRGELVEPRVDAQLQQYAFSLEQNQRDEDDTLGQQFAQQLKIVCR